MATEATVLMEYKNTGWDAEGTSFIVCDGKNHYTCDNGYSHTAKKDGPCTCNPVFITRKEIVIGNDRYPFR